MLFVGLVTVAQSPVPFHPLLEHPGQYRDVPVHVVVDSYLPLSGAMAVQTPCVLDQSTFPGDGKGEEQRVEASVVESFADVPSRGEHQPFLVVRNRRESLHRFFPLPGGQSPFQDDQVAGEFPKTFGQKIEVVLPFRQENRGSAFFKRFQHIIEAEHVAVLVCCEDGINLLDPRVGAEISSAEVCLPKNQPLFEGLFRRVALP